MIFCWLLRTGDFFLRISIPQLREYRLLTTSTQSFVGSPPKPWYYNPISDWHRWVWSSPFHLTCRKVVQDLSAMKRSPQTGTEPVTSPFQGVSRRGFWPRDFHPPKRQCVNARFVRPCWWRSFWKQTKNLKGQAILSWKKPTCFILKGWWPFVWWCCTLEVAALVYPALFKH